MAGSTVRFSASLQLLNSQRIIRKKVNPTRQTQCSTAGQRLSGSLQVIHRFNLDYLRSLGISYILAGAQNIDLALALDKCDRLAGIHRITLQGGGIINGSFAKAGLIDEISLVITPVLEGTTGIATSFDTDEAIGMDEYRLIQTEVICDNGLWLNYQRK